MVRQALVAYSSVTPDNVSNGHLTRCIELRFYWFWGWPAWVWIQDPSVGFATIPDSGRHRKQNRELLPQFTLSWLGNELS
jgi:hypothetical protein